MSRILRVLALNFRHVTTQAQRVMKRSFADYILYSSVILIYSCKTSTEDFAIKWSKDIKEKIIADASRLPDRTVFDSLRYNITLYKGAKKLKFYLLYPVVDSITGKWISSDTAVSVFISDDQKFELVRELCPPNERGSEGISYEGLGFVGLTEFRYPDGKIMERGFRYDNKNVGVWTTYDQDGKRIKVKDYGDLQSLNKLRELKYYP